MNDPERYECNKSAPELDAEHYVPEIIKEMSWKGKRELVLDYGCGAGSTAFKLILPHILNFDSALYSVDISADMVAYARKLYSHPGITYAVGDILADDFPYRELKFDKIFCIYVLHFVKQYREALNRFYRLLKPGGQLGLTVTAKSVVYKVLEQLGTDPKWAKYMRGYQNLNSKWEEDKEDAETAFRRNLEATGFEIVKLTTQRRVFVFDKFETAIELMVSFNPFVKLIPTELHASLRHDYRVLLAQSCGNVPTDSKSLETSYDALYAVVRKPMGK